MTPRGPEQVVPFHTENAPRGTSHRPHRTLAERRERYTLTQRLIEQHRITYDAISDLSGESLATCHRALDPTQFRRMRWESLCRIRFAVCLLLPRRRAMWAKLWDEYDAILIAPITNLLPPVARAGPK